MTDEESYQLTPLECGLGSRTLDDMRFELVCAILSGKGDHPHYSPSLVHDYAEKIVMKLMGAEEFEGPWEKSDVKKALDRIEGAYDHDR